jgi:hypothetical protein
MNGQIGEGWMEPMGQLAGQQHLGLALANSGGPGLQVPASDSAWDLVTRTG